MNVLLLSMPDSFEHMPPIVVRMPNGGLTSLAGNIDAHHRVAVADLILVQSSVTGTVERLVRDLEPDIVGLSVMTFQRATALALARRVRSLRPSVRMEPFTSLAPVGEAETRSSGSAPAGRR